MIIWLASYPKSGNTWIRSFLNSLLFTKSGEANLNKLTNIYQFPVRSQFKDISSNLDDLKELSKNWIKTQEKINKEKKVKIFKTHNGLYKIETNTKNEWVNIVEKERKEDDDSRIKSSHDECTRVYEKM